MGEQRSGQVVKWPSGQVLRKDHTAEGGGATVSAAICRVIDLKKGSHT